MKKEFKYISAILKGRFKDEKMIFGFEIKLKEDKVWEACIKYGVPETCACVFYIGESVNMTDAIEKCIERCIIDEPLKTEIG